MLIFILCLIARVWVANIDYYKMNPRLHFWKIIYVHLSNKHHLRSPSLYQTEVDVFLSFTLLFEFF